MNMNSKKWILSLFTIGFVLGNAHGDEHAAIKAKFLENIQVNVKLLEPETLEHVFKKPVYEFEVRLFNVESPYHDPLRDFVAIETEQGVDRIQTPSTNEKLPWLMALIDPDFRLNEDTAPKMEAALRAVMSERFFEMEKNDEVIVALPGEWRFMTGTFFDNLKGFILKVNDDGQVTEAVYSLSIGKE